MAVIGVLFGLASLFGFIDMIYPTPAAVPVSIDSPAPNTEPLTLDQKIRTAINDELGTRTNEGDSLPRIAKLEIGDDTGTGVEGDKFVIITLNANKDLTDYLTAKGMLLDSSKVFPTIFKQNNNISEVMILWHTGVEDMSGKTTHDITVMKVELTKSIYKMINWHKFNVYNFPQAASSFWAVPEIRSMLQ